jgi:molybdopterin synthase catalytic subunit
MALQEPNMDEWLAEAKRHPQAGKVGMYLTHNGVVRATPKHTVRAEAEAPADAGDQVVAVEFSYDADGLARAIDEALGWDGIYYVRVWLNEGRVPVGGSLMYVLIGADIRPHAIDALQRLVGHIKRDLVMEREQYA